MMFGVAIYVCFIYFVCMSNDNMCNDIYLYYFYTILVLFIYYYTNYVVCYMCIYVIELKTRQSKPRSRYVT